MANLDIFEREGINAHVKEQSPVFRATLERLLDLPIVGDVRGEGFFFGIELVKDKATRETFDEDESERLLRGFLSKALFDGGLYCRADDRGDPVVQLAPPLVARAGRVRRDRADPAGGADRGVEAAVRSLWFDQVVADGDPLTPRPPLDGDTAADVAVVGAGYTGLWTAYYLLRGDPSLRVVVVEREIAGFGASGRNGGWCSALLPASADELARRHGPAAADAMRAAMRDTVDEVGKAVAEEGIDCDWVKGGTVTLGAVARAAAAGPRRDADLLDADARPPWWAPPACWAARSRPTARGSSRRASSAVWRGPSSARGGCIVEGTAATLGRAAPRRDRPRDRHGARRSCGRRRPGRRTSPRARWSRCTR